MTVAAFVARPGRLQGKTALVTAAAQGIGRATAELFAREGATVWASDINEPVLARVACNERMVLDVCDMQAVSHAPERTGPLDILVNCAGFVAGGSILECSEHDWLRSFEVNVTSMFRLTRAYLPGMLRRGGGSIVNVSSVVGAVRGVANRFAYASTKAAVLGLTKSIAADFVTQGIRCNAICPGTIDTPSLHARLRATEDYAASLETFKARQPMRRLGMPEEVANLALYLASDESAFTTGQWHIIDGGWSN
ncbi:MAG TPA: SDR family oxidoreductase [Steroidobacteraceae bacterium]|nr:SDR family oxidoreductase [Steroidobacteraceae bacterium]